MYSKNAKQPSFKKSSRYQLLTEEEKKILIEWNQTRKNYPNDKTIHQLFEEQAEKNSKQTAVVFEDTSLTYRELNEKANQLAHFLREKGIKPEMLVAIACERSLDIIIGLLAILKAGGAYVPLDPSYPMERLSYMMEDTKASVLLTQSHLINNLPTTNATVILLDDTALFKNYPTSNLGHTSQPYHLAYVIYTSGTTGRPKGVMIEHRNVNRLIFSQNYVEINAASIIAQTANMSFDAATFEIWGALLYGARLILIPTEIILSALTLKSYLKKNRVNIMWLTKTLFDNLFDHNPNIFKNLNYLLIGGEALDPIRVRKIIKKGMVNNLINGYGPTESTTFSVCCNLSHYQNITQHIAIGKPIANTQVYILDTTLHPLPVGMAGELLIGGDGLSRGYLNQPLLTAEKFINNPFLSESDKNEGRNLKLYKTGDLCRWLEDGNIEYLGRIDEQVKLRGFRIELGEIEYILKQHAKIKDSVVILKEDNPENKKLIVYFVSKESFLDTEDLRSFLKTKLPNYMIPSFFIKVEDFPLTPNGKLDKKALLEITPQDMANYVAPKTEIERSLISIWEKTLEVNNIGIDSNFFALGGHSLLATDILTRINKSFNIKLSIQDILNNPTITSLARIIDSSPTEEFDSQKPTHFLGKEINLPLTSSQEQIWFHLQEAQGEPIYNEPFTITMKTSISHIILEKSVNEIIKRHAALRTKISLLNGIPVQSITPYSFYNLAFIDLSSIKDQNKCLEETYKIATIEAKKSFDLEKDLLVRLILIKLGETFYKFFIVAHHLILDGISMYKIFYPELIELYKASLNNHSAKLPMIDFEYADYSLWNKSRAINFSKEKNFWGKVLEGAEDISFGKIKQGFKGKREVLAFEKKLSDGLRHLSCQYGVSHFIIFLATLNVLLYKYTGQKDLCIVSAASSRNQWFLENTFGNFLNSVIFRNNISEDLVFSEFLTQVNQNALKVYEHQELPLQEVSKLIKTKGSDKLPLSVALVLEPPLKPNDLNWELSQLEIHTNTAKFPLTIELDERPEGIIGRIEYNIELFSESFIQNFISHFKKVLQHIISQPSVEISEIDILNKKEKLKILIGWNQTRRNYPNDKTLHQLFEEQAEKNPKQTAIVFEDTSLTYRELNEKANQLAHLLRKKGIKPEMLVAIACERSLDIIIGLLAILKAGGAYVPLDPSYPMERLSYMMEDTKASVLLTQSHLIDSLPTTNATVILLDDTALFKDYSTSNLEHTSQPYHLAYVIYTSGTTGRPKGVMIEHKSICNRLFWWQQDINLESTDVFLHQFSFSFDGAVVSLFWPLLNGVKVILPTSIGLGNPNYIVLLIQKEKVTTLLATPTVMSMLYDHPHMQKAKHVNKVMLAGENFTQDMYRKYQSGQNKIYNFYGPTETTIIATCYNATKEEITRPSVPIGSPIANTQVYILDTTLRPLPVGMAGELFIGGDGLSRGYLNQPLLTAEKFINNPFLSESDKNEGRNLKLYKTGDLCRWLEDGNIEYLGRIDEQVKLRGFRIELGEIEYILKQHAKIKDSVVILKEDDFGDKNLIAYYIPKENSVAIEDLKSFLKTKLPYYMIPSYFVEVKHFPLTPNGKLDKKALLKISHQNMMNYVAPQTQIEKTLTQLVTKVLHKEKIGIHDDFSNLGITSLNRFSLITSMHQENINVSIQQLNTYSTVHLLSRSIDLGLKEKKLICIKKNKKSSRDCIVFIPPAGGTIDIFNPLAKKLNYPMISVLQFIEEDLKETSIQNLAQKNIDLLRHELPDTRYILIGHSFGAILAYEMAQILEKNQLPCVFMIDTGPLVNKYYKITGDLKIHGLIMFAIINSLPNNHILRWIDDLEKLSDDKKVAYIQEKLEYKFTIEQIKHFTNFYVANMKQIKNYNHTPNRTDVEFIFCRAQNQDLFKENHRLFSPENTTEAPFDQGLFEIIDNLKVISIPGNHVSMLHESHVEFLAREIQEHLPAVLQ